MRGERQTLKKIIQGGDFYVRMAKKVFNKSEITKEERYIAKRAVLARGYGLGHSTLMSILSQDEIYISPQRARELLRFYDEVLPKVKSFWYEMFKPFKQAVKGKVLDEVKIRDSFFRQIPLL